MGLAHKVTWIIRALELQSPVTHHCSFPQAPRNIKSPAKKVLKLEVALIINFASSSRLLN